MKNKFVLGLALLGLASGFVTDARADVQSSTVDAKSLFEVLYSMESNGTKSVTSQLVVSGDFTVLTETLGKGPNTIACKRSVSASGDSTYYDCNLKKEITFPSSPQ